VFAGRAPSPEHNHLAVYEKTVQPCREVLESGIDESSALGWGAATRRDASPPAGTPAVLIKWLQRDARLLRCRAGARESTHLRGEMAVIRALNSFAFDLFATVRKALATRGRMEGLCPHAPTAVATT
jgi:hypothetical protein